MPGGGQSRAETWSLLSDSTMDTRYSGKKWPVPTGETQPDPTTCNCLTWQGGQKGLSVRAGVGGSGPSSFFFLLTNYLLTVFQGQLWQLPFFDFIHLGYGWA